MTSTPEPRREQQQIAVWYFVGATFVFGMPAAFLTDPAPWVRLVFLVIGFALVVAGGVQLGRELRQRRGSGRAGRPD